MNKKSFFIISVLLLFVSLQQINAQPFGGYLSISNDSARVTNNRYDFPRLPCIDTINDFATDIHNSLYEEFEYQFFFYLCDSLELNEVYVLTHIDGIYLYLYNVVLNDTASIRLKLTSNSTIGYTSRDKPIPVGEWVHVLVKFLYWPENILVFIDGKIEDRYIYRNGFEAGISYIELGYKEESSPSFDNHINCYFDEFKASSFSTIDYNTDSIRVPDSPLISDQNTLALYHFDDKEDALVLKDDSGNKFHLVSYNNAHVNKEHGIYIDDRIKRIDTICPYDTLHVRGGQVVEWFPKYGLSDYYSKNPVVNIIDTTIQYVVLITDSNNCTINYDTILLTVFYVPEISVSSDTLICYGDTINITSIGGDSALWLPDYNIVDRFNWNVEISPNKTTEYIARVYDSIGCFSMDTTLVEVNRVVAFAGNDTNICFIDSTILNGEGGVKYEWSPSLLLNDSSLQNPTIYIDTSVSISLTVWDTLGCMDQDTLSILYAKPITITKMNDTTVCPGSQILLEADFNNANNLYWNEINNIFDTLYSVPLISVDTTLTLIITIEDTLTECYIKDTIKVIAYPYLNIFEEDVLSVCENTLTQISYYSTDFTSLIKMPSNIEIDSNFIYGVFNEDILCKLEIDDQINKCRVSDSVLIMIKRVEGFENTTIIEGCENVEIPLRIIPCNNCIYNWESNPQIFIRNEESFIKLFMNSYAVYNIEDTLIDCILSDTINFTVKPQSDIDIKIENIFDGNYYFRLYVEDTLESYLWSDSTFGFQTFVDQESFLIHGGIYSVIAQNHFWCFSYDTINVFDNVNNQNYSGSYFCDIFPNPFVDQIAVSTNDVIDQAELIIHDIRGTKVFEGIIESANQIISLEQLLPGIYIANITSVNANTTILLVKQ